MFTFEMSVLRPKDERESTNHCRSILINLWKLFCVFGKDECQNLCFHMMIGVIDFVMFFLLLCIDFFVTIIHTSILLQLCSVKADLKERCQTIFVFYVCLMTRSSFDNTENFLRLTFPDLFCLGIFGKTLLYYLD